MATVLDTLFVELGLDAKKFQAESKQATQTLDKVTKSATNSEKAIKKIGKTSKKTAKETQNFAQVLGKVHKGLLSFFALATGSNAFVKLASDTAKANVELDNLSKNIGMSGDKLMKWGHMAQMAGGNSQAMTNTLSTLSQSITRLTVMGDTTLVPFFNALGVSLLDNNGKARDLDKIMLDLADSFGKMERTKAYGLAKSMGFDDDTINTLMLGRAKMQEMLDIQKNIYKSSEQEIKASRELTKAKGLLSAQYESLKLKIGNALVPVLTKMVKLVSGFVEFLNAHEYQAKNFFIGIATTIGLVLLPMLIKAGLAMLAFAAPILVVIAAVTALSVAFGLLYDDYATWAKGGKSLFDWSKFKQYIDDSSFSVDNLKKSFVYLLTGYQSWAEVYKGAVDWLKQKGFIDENGVSVNSLATGFKNFAKDLLDYVAPALQDVMELLNALRNGDFSRAWEMSKNLGKRAINQGLTIGQAVGGRVLGAVDTALGHDPNSSNSLKSTFDNGVGATREMLGINQLHQNNPWKLDFGANFSRKHQDIEYLMGGKNIKKGIIDCSGYIDALNREVASEIERIHGKEVAKSVRVNGAGGAAGIIKDQEQKGRSVASSTWKSIDTNLLKEGMVIGESRGGHASGRHKGIGHIVAIIERDGKKYVTESTSAKGKDGKTGVRETELSEYIKEATNRKNQFAIHVVDPYKNIRGNVLSKAETALSSVAPKANANPAFSGSKKPFRNANLTDEKAKIIAETAQRLGMNPNDLAAVISFETGGTFSPNKRNPYSSATGLIQFMRGSGGTKGKYYGMTRDQFGNLSFAEQMKYVEKYFRANGFSAGKKVGVADVYSAVTGWGHKKGTQAYELNKVWDSNKNGVVEKGEMVQNSAFKAHQRDYFGGQIINPPNAAVLAQNAISQSQALQQAQQVAHNKTVNVSINGGVSVQTSANHVDGIATDAGAAIRDRIAQLMPAMM